MYDEAAADLDGFWLERTTDTLEWDDARPLSRWHGTPHTARGLPTGALNVSVNCLDRHVAAGRGDKVAYHFVSEPEDEEDRAITFSELKDDVCRFAAALRKLGIGKGDMVGIYMGMVPELPIAMLACARLGAPHVVVFGGFSAEALGERLESHRRQAAGHPGRGLAQGQPGGAQADRRRGRRSWRRPSSDTVVLKRTGGGRGDGRRAATSGGTT